ncbi:MAG: hypothetical protein PVI21_03565 [Candidatus Woesebacteria bacterium]
MQHLAVIKETISNVYWSFLLEGIAFIILAILVVIYPALLIALASVAFLFIGISSIILAIKIKSAWNKLPKILK